MDTDPQHAPPPNAAIAKSRRDALRHLGWSGLCAHLRAALCSSVARDQLDRDLEEGSTDSESAFAPETELKAARLRLLELDGAEALDRAEGSLADPSESLRGGLRRLLDLEETLAAAVEGAPLDPLELWAVRELLEIGDRFASLLNAARVESRTQPTDQARNGLEAMVARMSRTETTRGELNPLVPAALRRELTTSLELGGEQQQPRIADAASEALARARQELRSSKQSLLTRAERVLRSATMAKALQDAYWTERDGRVVLPVRSDALGTLRRDGRAAIIHGSSASGNTLFVEPQGLVDANNAFREAQTVAAAEERLVRARLSASVGAEAPALRELQLALVRYDFVQARLALSNALDGLTPTLFEAPGGKRPCDGSAGALESGEGHRARIHLEDARHPLMALDGVDVVPNSIELRLGHGLVISGPNAGGKTVALKTLGLCSLMARAGVRLPTSRPGRLPLFAHLVTDVGDDQSITANLSTFSAHLGHVMEALEIAALDGPNTLVLLDEVAVGTDPEQGAALAEAILLALVESGATVVATTHYDRLKLLATRDADDPRFHNAAVGFDLENMRPTFRLTLGVPGSSSAIAVARRLGMPEPVLQGAEELLSDESLKVDVLLQGIDAERQALADARARLEAEKARIQQRDRQVQQREQRALDGARSRKRKAFDSATSELRQLESELRSKRKRLHKQSGGQAGIGDALPTRAEATATERGRIEALRDERPPTADGVPVDSVGPGDRVRVASLGGEGEVVVVKGKKVTVQLGNSRVTVTREDLLAPATSPTSSKKGRTPGRKSGAPIHSYKQRAPIRMAARHFGADAVPVKEGFDNACDLRGTRAEDAADAVEDFISTAIERDQDVIVIRHGHGSGALRSVLREHLARLPHVRRHRGGLPQEGGDAVTVVELA
jgi:DNA mismatch repair protein MutS2